MSTSRTAALVAAVRAGTHRIVECRAVWRWVPSRSEWVTDPSWRSDVIRRAVVLLDPRSK